MQRDLCAYLHDMLDASESIFDFTGGIQFTTFENLDLNRSAVERKFEIIGEALRQASQYFPGSLSSIPDLKEAIGQRDRLAHGYFAVDPMILWHSIKNDLPAFRDRVARLIELNCDAISPQSPSQ
ncbi:MAG: DUF86 domain-containing protein [Acidobacteriota bacterium]